jgi:PAS domain S-box-containing protein
MDTNQPDQGAANDGTNGIDRAVEQEMLHRARQIAFLDGRSSHETSESDLEQAKRESTDKTKYPPAPAVAGHDTKLLLAENRTIQAEARTEQAKSRTEQAESRTEQAETRTEQAKTRTEQAETRTEQAEARSQQAIQDSELNYRRLFEAAKEGILILESDTGRISDVNPFLVEMLGLSRAELVGTPIWELGPFKDIVSNHVKFEHLQNTGYVSYENLPLETKGGHKMLVEFVSNVYHVGDRNVIQCYVRDITARKRLEESIRVELEQRVADRTKQLEECNLELHAFSYSVSHDLQAPVRHLLEFSKLLLRKSTGVPLSPEDIGYLSHISGAANRMKNLIEDLLLFARVGRAELRKTQVNLEGLVRETVSEPELNTKERQIVWDIHALPEVLADRGLLRLVLVNLISNAVKFTAGRSPAKIEIGCGAEEDAETTIYIRDNGAGFDPACAHKLFGVFQRLHSHEEFEGTGIGLANVQRIIQRHGGRVWAEGAVDKGATFYFSLLKQSAAA